MVLEGTSEEIDLIIQYHLYFSVILWEYGKQHNFQELRYHKDPNNSNDRENISKQDLNTWFINVYRGCPKEEKYSL